MTGCVESPTCTCESCSSADLAVNPFVALRVAYGMLLGVDDLDHLMGNPRGKQMVHSSWLHGTGVVWGYGIRCGDDRTVAIAPGLALDGVGRELFHRGTTCLDLYDLAADWVKGDPPQAEPGPCGCHGEEDRPDPTPKGSRKKTKESDCRSWRVHVCLVASFDTCLASPVPTPADPCDVTRKHDDYSRVVERVRFGLVDGCCDRPTHDYHRVRVLLGLDPVGSTPADEEATDALEEVLAAPASERVSALLEQFRRMAALDAVDRGPRVGEDGCAVVFPVDEEDAGVPLACLRFRVVERDGCREVEDVCVDQTVRTALLPTAEIQELLTGLAPGLLGDTGETGATGPQVVGSGVRLRSGGDELVVPVTAPLVASTVRGALTISSLSSRKGGGWVMEDIYDTTYDEAEQAIVASLADPPANPLVRIVVRGTGRRPVMGADPVLPLAGVVGDRPLSTHDGRDAVWTFVVEDLADASDTETEEAGA